MSMIREKAGAGAGGGFLTCPCPQRLRVRVSDKIPSDTAKECHFDLFPLFSAKPIFEILFSRDLLK
jgi:hypothetical protein